MTTVAQLDTTSLEMELHTAEANLAQAQLTLENGLNGEKASSTPTGGLSPTNVSTTSATSDTRIVLTASTTDPTLAAAQQAVLQAQHNVDAAIATASTAYQNAVSVCTTDPPDTSVCQDALEASLDAQKDVQTDSDPARRRARSLRQPPRATRAAQDTNTTCGDTARSGARPPGRLDTGVGQRRRDHAGADVRRSGLVPEGRRFRSVGRSRLQSSRSSKRRSPLRSPGRSWRST